MNDKEHGTSDFSGFKNFFEKTVGQPWDRPPDKPRKRKKAVTTRQEKEGESTT